MGSDYEERIERFLRNTARGAGRRLETAKQAYRTGRATSELPTDDDGKVKLVCRRYAERRAVELDDLSRPDCFEADHPDCQGCLEDVRSGIVETW